MELTNRLPTADPLDPPPAAELAADESDPAVPPLARDDEPWRRSRERRPVLDSEGYPIP